MATFRVARASEYLAITGWGVDDVKLAKKAWVWLGLQRCKTLDVLPVSHYLEAQGVTSEGFPVVLGAVYTVGPKIDAAANGDKDHPLVLYAKLVAESRRSKDRCSKSHVKKLVQGVFEGHVRGLAPGLTTEEILVKRGTGGGFEQEALDRVQMDLGKFGIYVYHANVKKLRINVPANKYLSDILAGKKAQLGAAVTNQLTDKVDVAVVAEEGGFSVQVKIGDREAVRPATKKTDVLHQVKVVERKNAEQLSKAAVPIYPQSQHLLEQVLPHAALYISTRKAAAPVDPFEQMRMKADADRFLEKDLPNTTSSAMDNARKAFTFLLRGETSATQQAAERFFEQQMPGFTSEAMDRACRAFAVLVGGDDDTSATQQQVAGAGVQEQTGAAAPAPEDVDEVPTDGNAN